jgi:hypothetical protein
LSNLLQGRHLFAVGRVRALLAPPERALFDLMCAAAHFGYPLPAVKINVSRVSGAKDPRRRLDRQFSSVRRGNQKTDKSWARAGERLARLLIKQLAVPKISDDDRALRVFLAYTTIGLAPDCVVPKDPFYRAGWNAAVKLYSKLFPSRLALMGPLECVNRQLSILQRDSLTGLRIGRRASGRRPGREGQALALDPKLVALAGKALRRKLVPAYIARYLFYTKPGDHIWPHPDDPKPAVNFLICISHDLPRRDAARSAFLAYAPDGSVKRYEIAPGNGLVFEPGIVHAREPVRRGERVVLLSIGLNRA